MHPRVIAVSGCDIGCNIRSSVMLFRFLAPVAKMTDRDSHDTD